MLSKSKILKTRRLLLQLQIALSGKMQQLWQDAPVFDWEQIAASLKFYRGPNSTLNGPEYQ
ncbi:hypothetical protein SynPROS91_00045 [Synechococcus sp. PROS-9-1]|nr:hypothetical protein SynPROS91_00045 [Synechococcus sp. PROS-9-1]